LGKDNGTLFSIEAILTLPTTYDKHHDLVVVSTKYSY